MEKLKIPICLLFLCLLTGCGSRQAEKFYTIVKEHYSEYSHMAVLYDGTYLYDYDYTNGTLDAKRLPVTETVTQSMYLMEMEQEYVINYLRPGSYYGSFESGCSYINKLKKNGYRIESYDMVAEYIDMMLCSEEGRIRVIVMQNSQIKIFYETKDKIAGEPPYLNGQ